MPSTSGNTTATILAGGNVLDVATGEVTKRDIAVVGGVVVEASRASGGDKVDASGRTVMFGLWDVHAHPASRMYDFNAAGYFETVAQHTVRAGGNLLQAVSMGITGIRTAAEGEGIDTAWRDAVLQGRWPGPRIKCSGQAIRTTGGHGTAWPRQYLHSDMSQVADGVTQMRIAVRTLAERGADWVKILLTGGLYSPHETVDSGQFLDDELEAVMATAKQRGLPVLAHCGSARLAQKFSSLGGRSVEHGYALDEAAAKVMAKNGTWLTPTIGVTHDEQLMKQDGWPPHAVERALASAKRHAEAILIAHQAGVKLATGADLNPIGPRLHSELRLLEAIGLSRADVLRAATAGSRELNGLGAETSPTPGAAADLIVLEGNPMDDMATLQKPVGVMVAGRFVVDPRGGSLSVPNPGSYAK